MLSNAIALEIFKSESMGIYQEATSRVEKLSPCRSAKTCSSSNGHLRLVPNVSQFLLTPMLK